MNRYRAQLSGSIYKRRNTNHQYMALIRSRLTHAMRFFTKLIQAMRSKRQDNSMRSLSRNTAEWICYIRPTSNMTTCP